MGYMQSGELDEAERKRLERNIKQQKRCAEMSDEQRQEINRRQREYRSRAEMSDEQRQEINRRQREYRARKKAEAMQDNKNPETVRHPSVLTPTVAGL